MADDFNDEQERQSLARALRQQLESLARAGLDRVPAAPPPHPALSSTRSAFRTARPQAPPGIESRDVVSRSEEGDGGNPRTEPPSPVSPPVALTPPPAVPSPATPLPVPSLAVLFGASEFDTPPVPACDRPALLGALAAEVAVCRRCPHLADTRTQTVFGVGSPETRLMFIGEAPGADEDRTGEPFVGRAGQLLTDMITKGMGLLRAQVFIANILKCRPPENRTPSIDEANNCFPYLEQQIAIIRPEFICLLGKVAVQAILNTNQAMGKMRGRWHRYRGIPTLVTYHPSYLLRTPSAKKDTWEDLQMLMKEMGLPLPSKK